MSMNVSEMQSILDRLGNGFDSHRGNIPDSQWREIEKSIRILKSNIGKIQKKHDREYKLDHMSFDPGLETGMEYCGDTELMY